MTELLATPENVRLKVPSGWHDITISQFAQACNYIQQDEITSEQKIIMTLCKIKRHDWKRLNFINAERIIALVAQILNERPKDKHIKEFSFRGQTYQLPTDDLSTLTYERYMEINTLFSMVKEGKTMWNYFHQIISCLIGRHSEERSNLFLDLPMSTAFQVFFFMKEQTKLISINSVSSGAVVRTLQTA